MTQPEITVETINNHLYAAIRHLYPDLTETNVEIEHREDETIVINPGEFPPLRAVIHSDDDQFLRFTPFDADDEPEDDDHEFLSIRIKVY